MDTPQTSSGPDRPGDAGTRDRAGRTLDFPPEHLQVLAHYYRAEVYRSAVWRTRLDVTTNWAIIAMTAAFSWSYTSDVHSHILFPITSCVVLFLLLVETRRYRYYDLWWTRARLLEGHLVVPALNPDLRLLQGDWREFLSNDLLLPSFKLSFWEAFVRRLVNIYVYVFIILFLGWFVRIFSGADGVIDGVQDGWVTLDEFLSASSYGLVPSEFTIGFEIAFMGGILTILFVNWKARNISGEIRRRDPRAPRWPV